MSKMEPSLYTRLGGIYSIAAVVDLFSEKILDNDLVGINSNNPQLREWSRHEPDRLPGLKWLRTLWVAEITGGPFKFQRSELKPCPFRGGRNRNMLDLREAHCKLRITSDQFEAVAGELENAMDEFKVPQKEQDEVMNAFFAHQHEVVSG